MLPAIYRNEEKRRICEILVRVVWLDVWDRRDRKIDRYRIDAGPLLVSPVAQATECDSFAHTDGPDVADAFRF